MRKPGSPRTLVFTSVLVLAAVATLLMCLFSPAAPQNTVQRFFNLLGARDIGAVSLIDGFADLVLSNYSSARDWQGLADRLEAVVAQGESESPGELELGCGLDVSAIGRHTLGVADGRISKEDAIAFFRQHAIAAKL